MKRRPCTRVPIPSPKRRLRSGQNRQTSDDTNTQTPKNANPQGVLTGETNSQEEENVNLKAKSPFYKKIIDHPKEKTKVVKKMNYDGPSPSEMVCRSPESTGDTGELMEAERSGVSLNSSYLTISTANSSMSQESSEACSEDRFSNSQSSKDGFTLNRSSGGSEQLDYNDTLTSGERTPKAPSPVNGQVQNSGHDTEKSDYGSESNRSTTDSPAIEVVIERDTVEIIDYDKFIPVKETENPVSEKLYSRLENKDNTMPVSENSTKSATINGDKAAEDIVKTKQSEDRMNEDVVETEDKGKETMDQNNNISGISPEEFTSDQEVMAKTYQTTTSGKNTDEEIRDNNNNLNEVNRNQVPNQELLTNTCDKSLERETGTEIENSKQNSVTSSAEEPMVLGNEGETGINQVLTVAREMVVPVGTNYSAVMPHDLEPRQLMQVRQEASCPLSPITEEHLAVERVAKELVNNYGGKNSDRIPEMLHDQARLADYDYNSFIPGLPYQQSRDARQLHQQQQMPHSAEYLGSRNDLQRGSHATNGHLTNTVPFGDPQGSSTPDLYQGKPICFSPDDFPSPYSNFDAQLSNQSWPGTNNYPNTYSQNSRQPDYFLPENPLATPKHTPISQLRSAYKGKGVIDLQGGGDCHPIPQTRDSHPIPQAHDNTTMTFTPRALMESHLSSNYFSGNSQSLSQKQSVPSSAASEHPKRPLSTVDCSSIYPSRDFIEKTPGSGYQQAAPGRVPSYEALVPPPKKRKLRSLSDTDIAPNKPEFSGYHLELPPIENRYGPPRHKYYVVNPSDLTTMPPKTLISKYIDFLILENEQITEISKSVSQPVDIYVTEDMYFMDNLKMKVPFPSRKFMEWVRSFYPKLRLENMRFQGMGQRPSDMPKGEDRRPTQQVLEDIFYFFQRQAMNLEG